MDYPKENSPLSFHAQGVPHCFSKQCPLGTWAWDLELQTDTAATLQESHTAGHGELQTDCSLEMGAGKERPWKMLLTENLDKVMVVSQVTG